jgi:hypothetical protein
MARQFQYYDPWRTEPLSCECGWSGMFQEGVVGHNKDLMESECPRCSKLVALVQFPTAEEVEQNEPEGSPFKEQVRATQKRWSAFRTMGLKSAEQLPEIAGEEVLLEWDFEADGLDEKWTVIRNGEQEVFRELAFWEGWERYMQVAAILKQKYGARLVDFRPTERSLLYLWGDKLSAPAKIAEFRRMNFPRGGQ